jgi:hypothetical protein
VSVSQPGPGARERRRDLIVTWHAMAHDELDKYGIPRHSDGLEFTLAERIEHLADIGKVPLIAKSPGITPASEGNLGPQGQEHQS